MAAVAPPDADWWREADAVSTAPHADAVARLRDASAALPDDDASEDRDEMLSGLDQALALTAGALPVLVTQHRVIGADVCHLVVPATILDPLPAAGKVFVTSARLIVVAGAPRGWAWHRVRAVRRTGRDVVATVAGAAEHVRVQCNSFGDAIAVALFAARLGAR